MLTTLNAAHDPAVPLSDRLAVPLSADAIESLVYFLAECPVRPHAVEIAWDLQRLNADDLGYDSFALAVAAFGETPAECWHPQLDGSHVRDATAYLDRTWATFDRPMSKGDALIIDWCDEAIAFGWKPPAEVVNAVERLRDIADKQRAERYAAAECEADAIWDARMAEFERARVIARENDWPRTELMERIVTEGTDDLGVAREIVDWVNECIQTDKENMAHIVAMNDLENAYRARAVGLMEQVERKFISTTDYIREAKTGIPENNNVDNVAFLLKTINAEVRFEAWKERVEIRTEGTMLDASVHWPAWTYLDDRVVSSLRTHASRTKTRFTPAKEFLWDALLSLAHVNTVDPARSTLDQLAAAWDGTPRLDTWLSATCGVPNDAYHAAVGRNLIGGMVKRIRKPGCKHDETVVFIGRQGIRKSTLIGSLAPNPNWYAESIRLGDEAKELVLALAGKAVCEIQEMGQRTRDVNAIKAMLSRTTDAGRTAYARAVTERPRRNIFVASTNDESPLIDDTGNRRWLPVRVECDIDTEWFLEHRDQLIGEAATLEAAGETFAIPREVWAVAATHQDTARERADFEILLDDRFGAHVGPVYITAGDLVRFLRAATGRSVPAGRYRAAMKALGFVNATQRVSGIPTKVWHRGLFDTAARYVLRQDGALAMQPFAVTPLVQAQQAVTALPY